MDPAPARWLAPLGAAAAVLTVIALPGLVAAQGSGAGVRPVPPPARLVLPGPLPGDRRDATWQLQVTGYRAAGRRLSVFYRVAPRSDCSSDVQRPTVTESTRSVAVRLVRTPGGRPDSLCSYQRLTASVAIRLAHPVGGRLVLDAGRAGAPVTARRP